MLVYLYLYTGVGVYYAENMETIGDNIREVKPDVFTAVPRLLEKVYDRIMDKGKALTGAKRLLFFWAVELAEEFDLYGKRPWAATSRPSPAAPPPSTRVWRAFLPRRD
jgi:long-chain acyl-CoA synthetase